MNETPQTEQKHTPVSKLAYRLAEQLFCEEQLRHRANEVGRAQMIYEAAATIDRQLIDCKWWGDALTGIQDPEVALAEVREALEAAKVILWANGRLDASAASSPINGETRTIGAMIDSALARLSAISPKV